MAGFLTRREAVLGSVAAAVATPALLAGRTHAASVMRAQDAKRVLRLGHLTDFHVQPELRAGEGMAACLEHVFSAKDTPQLILTGGDHVMDTFEQEESRVKTLWSLYQSVLKDHANVRVEGCIGNHDIWGWNKERSKTTGTEPNWGKSRAIEALGIPARYRSFDMAGWRFIVLDTVQVDPANGAGYVAGLDDEQFSWLESLLAKTPATMPVLVLSHIPIMHAAAGLFNATVKKDKHDLGASTICLDNLRIVHLFSRHPNVKLALSGHVHNLERIDFQGVSYICSGAVCGAWWKKPAANEKPHVDRAVEGYSLIDLFDDGSFAQRYETYGWKA